MSKDPQKLNMRYHADDPANDRLICILLLIVIGATMFLLNMHTPLQLDDYDYSFNWATGDKLKRIADVFASQRAHYEIWGGRSVVHTLVQCFLILGKPVFNLFNTIAYLALLFEIALLTDWRQNKGSLWVRILAAHAALFFGLPFFGTVFLWLDGACNYLWGTLIALWPLLFTRAAERQNDRKSVARFWMAVPLCFLAGWTNENTALGILLARGFWLIRARKRRHIGAWEWASLLAEGAGVLVLLLAPGNFSRAGQETLTLALRIRSLASGVYAFAATAAPLLAVIVFFWVLTADKDDQNERRWAFFLLMCGLLCGLALMPSPQVSDRAFTGMIAILLSAVLSLGTRIIENSTHNRTACLAALPFLLIVLITGGYSALREVKAQEALIQNRIVQIELAAAAGKTEVVLCDIQSVSRYTQGIGFAAQADEWPNSTLGRFYGIQIKGATDEMAQ